MKQLLTLSLVTFALLTVAGCASAPPPQHFASCTRLARSGDTKIQVYCASPDGDVMVVSDGRSKSCRRVVRPADGTALNFCGNRAEWDVFDTWAVSADMTCRWAGTRHELCADSAKWEDPDRLIRPERPSLRPLDPNVGSNWPGNNTTWVPYGSGAGSGCCPLDTGRR